MNYELPQVTTQRQMSIMIAVQIAIGFNLSNRPDDWPTGLWSCVIEFCASKQFRAAESIGDLALAFLAFRTGQIAGLINSVGSVE